MPTKQAIQAQFLRQEDTFTTCALAIVIDNFGTEALSWEPGTLNQELLTLGVEPSDLLSDKIQAGTTLLTTNLFHVSLEAFSNMVQVFSFQEADFQDFIPADLDEIAWGVVEARMIEGEEDQEFSHDIKRFVGRIMSLEGLTKKAKLLDWAVLPEGEEDNRDELLAQDQTFFSAYWQRQADVLQELDQMVSANARKLMEQLAQIPFSDADTSFVKKVLAAA